MAVSMRIYLAGPLFTDAERAFNAALAQRLEALGDHVFLPQRDAPQDKASGYPARIFRADLAGLELADVVVAVCDGALVDDGTAWEIGFAYARGMPVVGLRTDTRIANVEERMNLMIQECLAALASSVDELLARLEPIRAKRQA